MFKDCVELYNLCFDALDNMCQPLHGDVLDSLTIVMNGTLHINTFSPIANSNQTNHTKYTTICDWFLVMLDRFPNQTSQLLTHYIKAILTNPPMASGGHRAPTNVDTCVLFDREMYRSSINASIVPFLKELEYSSNCLQRMNCVEFVVKALLVKSVSSVECREIEMVRMLVSKINDPSDKVKVKAIAGFLRVATDGNEQWHKLYKVAYRMPNHYGRFKDAQNKLLTLDICNCILLRNYSPRNKQTNNCPLRM